MNAVKVILLLCLFELAVRYADAASVGLVRLGIGGEIIAAMVTFLLVSSPLLFAEWAWPVEKQDYSGIWLSLVFAVVSMFLAKLAAAIGQHVPHLFRFAAAGDVGTHVVIAATLLGMFVAEFFFYWTHRTMHSVPWLWRLHRVHHSMEHYNCLTFYSHWLEQGLRVFMAVIPASLIIAVDTPRVFIVSAFIITWSHFVHSGSTVSLGWLGCVFTDNAHHRIHHSLEPRHFDKNFAPFFPIFDRLFGTYCAPDGTWPKVGVSGTREPATIREYFGISVAP